MLAFQHGLAFSLRVTSQADTVATLTVRGMTTEGVFTFSHTTTNDGLATTTTHRIPDIPIMVSIIDAAASLEQGGCYVSLTLIANDDILYQLCSGLVYGQKAISYPVSPTNEVRPNGGKIAVTLSADPAAGAEAQIMVPTNEYWRIIAAYVELVTDATVSTRTMSLTMRMSGTKKIRVFAEISQAASTTRKYSFTKTSVFNSYVVDTDVIGQMPYEMWVSGGGSISTLTNNLQAADNIGVLYVLHEKFFEPVTP